MKGSVSATYGVSDVCTTTIPVGLFQVLVKQGTKPRIYMYMYNKQGTKTRIYHKQCTKTYIHVHAQGTKIRISTPVHSTVLYYISNAFTFDIFNANIGMIVISL